MALYSTNPQWSKEKKKSVTASREFMMAQMLALTSMKCIFSGLTLFSIVLSGFSNRQDYVVGKDHENLKF
jgi:hypothetical protein